MQSPKLISRTTGAFTLYCGISNYFTFSFTSNSKNEMSCSYEQECRVDIIHIQLIPADSAPLFDRLTWMTHTAQLKSNASELVVFAVQGDLPCNCKLLIWCDSIILKQLDYS